MRPRLNRLFPVVARDGQTLKVRVLGRGQPVLLLHGLGLDSRHWLPFIWPFLHRFRFYMPDFRGAGGSRSVRINQDDIFQNHMEDVQDIVDHFGLKNFLLAGYSLGGTTALHWQRAGGFAGVKRYLHIDQTPCISNRADWRYGLCGEQQDEIFGQLGKLRAVLAQHPDVEQLAHLPPTVRAQALTIVAETVSRIAGKPALRKALLTAARWPWLFSTLVPVPHLDDARRLLTSFLTTHHDYLPSLSDCPVPITVMVGMCSPLYHPAGQLAIAERAPQSRVVRMKHSGHVPQTDQPFRFTLELGRFLRG